LIIDLKKYLFIGVREDLDSFFERAQQRGIFEFIAPTGKKSLAHPYVIERLIAALKILRKLPKVKQDERRLGLDAALRTSEEVINLRSHVEKLQEEIRIVQAEIVRVAPLGDFSLEDLHFLRQEGKRIVQFFCVKSVKRSLIEDLPELIYLSTEYDLDYYMSISTRTLHPQHMIEMKVDLPVNDLKENLAVLEKELSVAQANLKKSAQSVEAIQEALIDEFNDFHLNAAKDEASYPLDNSLFVIEAWVPENKVPAVFAMLQGIAVHAEPILIEESDRIPTYMENKGSGKIGEDIVLIYDTPAATDKDPSRWVLWSFSIFFAMIINDACYGLLFLLLALFLKFKLPHAKASAKRFFNLLSILAVSCIVWGVLTTSYFGISILPENPLNKVSIIGYLAERKADYHLKKNDAVYCELVAEYPALSEAKSGKEMLQIPHIEEGKPTTYPVMNEFNGSIMLEISLLVGVIHLGLSLLRYLGRNWSAIGWLVFMIGGYLYFPKVIEATSLLNYLGIVSKEMAYAIGYQMIYIGIGAAVLLALIQKRLKGLTEIMHVVAIFADTLSYLRLYALALASTVMAETFNELGFEIGLAVGSLIILGGHMVNLLLGSMSGVIHGLRLNFLEWYHYSFQGGGKLFAPLHRLKKQ
jgi:V/A-type H+-transporting ATPase subunit I